MDNAVIVDFPLWGEWVAANTPAKKIPSHGTDMLGQRYAYDFLRTDNRKGMHFCDVSNFRFFLLGVSVKRCYCWGETVYAPFDGEIVDVKDGLKERQRLYFLLDLLVLIKNMIAFNLNRRDLHKIVGNYIIMKKDNIHAFFAHLLTNSICVHEGDKIKTGQELGKVGHTGNSTAPHLHFHLMDRADILTAQGIACAFRQYEAYRDNKWQRVTEGIPGYNERIRYMK
jgi:hypothetical protein